MTVLWIIRRSSADQWHRSGRGKLILFGVIIGAIAFAYYVFELNGILAFWLAYIFTRPLGASFGDLLSQPLEYGGLGFGTIVTSLMFLGCIVAIVAYMTVARSGNAGLSEAGEPI